MLACFKGTASREFYMFLPPCGPLDKEATPQKRNLQSQNGKEKGNEMVIFCCKLPTIFSRRQFFGHRGHLSVLRKDVQIFAHGSSKHFLQDGYFILIFYPCQYKVRNLYSEMTIFQCTYGPKIPPHEVTTFSLL